MNQRFPKTERLRSKADFAAMRQGRRLSSGGIRLVYRFNGLDHARLGLAVSKKFGNAVARNRLKRQLRDSFRRNGFRKIGIDLLVIPMIHSDKMKHAAADFSDALAMICRRHQLKEE